MVSAIQGGANDYIIKTSFLQESFLEKIIRLMEQVQQEAFNEELTLVATTDSNDSAKDIVQPVAERDMAATLADNWE